MSALQKGRMASQQFPTRNGKTVSVVAMSSNGTPLPTPLMSYYFNMPRNSPCVISVNNTGKAPRFYNKLLTIPAREIECWDQARIEEEARTIRAQYPAVAESIVVPHSWEDLYRYFDAHDLWLQGAWNLWAVIDELGYQNQKMKCYRQKIEEIRNMGPGFPLQPHEQAMIADFVEGWVSFTENRLVLIEWDGLHDILQLLSPVDWKDGGIEGLNQTQADFLRDELIYWHGHWRERYENPAQFFPPDQWHHLGGKYAKKDSLPGPRKRFVTPYEKPLVGPVDTLCLPASDHIAFSGPPAPYPGLQSVRITDLLPGYNLPAGAFSHPLPYSQPVPSFQPKPVVDSVAVSHSVLTGHPVVVNGSTRVPPRETVENGAITEKPTPVRQSTMSGSAPPFAPEKHFDKAATEALGPASVLALGEDLSKADTEVSGPAPSPAPEKALSKADTEAPGPSRLPKRSSGENMVEKEKQPVPTGPEEDIHQQEQQPASIGLEMSEKSYPARHNARKPSRKAVQPRAMTCPNPNYSNCYNRDKYPHRDPKTIAGHFVACPCNRCSALSRTALVKNIQGPEEMSQSEKAARLQDYFSRFGVIQQCDIKTSSSRNCYAFIRFSLENSAVAAVASADGKDLSPISNCIRTEHPWFSKYWTPKPYKKSPPEDIRVTPPSNRQSPPCQGSMNNAVAQHHVTTSSFCSPPSRNNVEQPHISPEHTRGPPPGFPPPVFNTQAGWQSSPPRMLLQPPPPVGMNGHRTDYLGPPHYQPPVPFHQQMAQIQGQPQAHCAKAFPHHLDQDFLPQGPPQWHHGPPHWHHGPMPPPPPPLPPRFHGPPHFAGHQHQPPLQGPPPFHNQGGHFVNAPRPVNLEVQTRQPLQQDALNSQPLAHSSSSSGDGSIRINLPGVSPEQRKPAQTMEKDNCKKAGSAESGRNPDEPSTSTDGKSPNQGQQLGDALERTIMAGEAAKDDATMVRSARFSIQDVRFDQDCSGTVRIRPNRRNQHQALPAEWLSESSRNMTPVEQATQPAPKQGTGSQNVTPIEQGVQPGPKKGKKNNKKGGARTSSRPSTPVDSYSNQPRDSKGKAPVEQPEPVEEAAALQVPGPKGYRADAGGSLKLSRNRKGPAIRTNHVVAQGSSPLNNGSPEEKHPLVSLANGDSAEQAIATKQALFKRFDSLSSIPDCPVLPRTCNLFPNYPDLTSSPPKIVMTPAETTPADEKTPRPETGSLTSGLSGMHRVSDSSVAGHSYCPSFHTARSTLSSRENSPPAPQDELFVSPPETPTRHSTVSQPSSATLSAHPSPKLAPAGPATELPQEDIAKTDIKPATTEPVPTSQPEAAKSEPKKQKNRNKGKKNEPKADTPAAGPSSASQPHEQQVQQPAPSESKPSSRPATPVENNSVRNSKKRKAQAKNAAEKRRTAAAATATAAAATAAAATAAGPSSSTDAR